MKWRKSKTFVIWSNINGFYISIKSYILKKLIKYSGGINHFCGCQKPVDLVNRDLIKLNSPNKWSLENNYSLHYLKSIKFVNIKQNIWNCISDAWYTSLANSEICE